ncbi:MAG: hypothetical protein GWN58_16030, partial [Anaerolineae bacterium]|nr:hypothetical protein [Anaerolineae bacterium]
MRREGISLRTILMFSIALGFVGVVGLFVHELGHGITAEVLGGEFEGLYVMPGVQVWPHPGKPYADEWQGYVGLAEYDPNWEIDSWQDGVVDLMGSGSTLLVAALALGALWLFRPRGWLRRLLLAEVLMFADILLYTFLPLLGLRHWFFFGGDYPEPLEGAMKLGVPQWTFMLLVALVSALMVWKLVMFV